MTGKYKAPTVKKAFEILRLVSRSNRGMKLSDLSRKLGISKSTVHGITSALEEIGAINRDPATKRYSPGVTLFELGRFAYSRIDLKDMARPFMEDLMAKTGESVFLGIRNGEHVTILDIVESMHDMKITSPIGATLPLLAGAVGKVILSALDENRVREIILEKGIPGFTEKTVTDPDRYLEEIRAAARNGFAADDEEYISGVRAVAALIQHTEHRTAAIWVVGFKPNMDGEKMDTLVEEIRAAAKAIRSKIEGRAAAKQ